MVFPVHFFNDHEDHASRQHRSWSWGALGVLIGFAIRYKGAPDYFFQRALW